jgi:hypothetical protein
MERFIQLNLRSDIEKAVPASLPNPERKEPESSPPSKRLHRLLNRAAHKAAAELGRNRSGIFSK